MEGGIERTESEAAAGGVGLDELVQLLGGVGAEGHGHDWVRVDQAHDLEGREGGRKGGRKGGREG